jgi:predicted dienelactone hydrolase
MMRRTRILFVSVCVMFSVAAEARQSEDPQVDDPYGAWGRLSVATPSEFNITDEARGKEVPILVRYPTGEGPFPLIVFSHGLGADREAFETVSEHWVTHGYIVVHPLHDDSGVGMTRGGMHPSEEKVRERLGDVIAVLDGLDQIDQFAPYGRIDRDRLAVAGHSYGSFITMIAGGITIEIGDDAKGNLGDSRVRCVLPISPSGRGDYGMADSSFNSLTKPAMFFAGTNDIRNGRDEDWRFEPYHFSPAGDKYLIVIEGATHNSYGGGRNSGDVPMYVKAASTAFWDSCLKGSGAAHQYLTGEGGFEAFAAHAATLSFK